MFRFAGALALAATAASAQLPVEVAQVIDNPGGACQECRFHPNEARASSESGSFRGKVDLEIDGTQANGEYLISSGSVKVTVYEVKDVGAPEEESVRIFVKFGKQAAAMKSYIDLDGRYFGGRNVWVCFFPEADFDAGKLAPSGKDPS